MTELSPDRTTPRIAVYAPMKNEAENLSTWLRSAWLADVLVLADTGSTDGSLEKAQELIEAMVTESQELGNTTPQIILGRVYIVPWRFDLGMNAALALVPDDVDVCIPMHLDEALDPSIDWVGEITTAWLGGANRMTHRYSWSPELAFQHDRIHARYGYRWHLPAHEGLIGPGPQVDTPVHIAQRRDETKDRSQDSALIKLGYAENPHDPRAVYYWGRQAFYDNDWNEGRRVLQAYLEMPGAVFDQERAEACRYIAKMVYEDQIESWLLRAAVESPARRECWADLAVYYAGKGQKQQAAGIAARALEITEQTAANSFHVEAWAWDDELFRSMIAKASDLGEMSEPGGQ